MASRGFGENPLPGSVQTRSCFITVENGVGGPAFAKASAVAKAMADKSADRLGSPPHGRF